MGRSALLLGVASILIIAAGCSSESEDRSAVCSEPIEPFKELVIVDDNVVAGPRAMNANAGVWSFRHAVENMSPPGVDPADFVRSWLSDWVGRKELNGYPLDTPNEERELGMNRFVLCPWLRSTPENACDAECATCASYTLDLAKAPFRLLAITNRMDLNEQLDAAPNGEGRLVFGLTDGPADDPSSKPLAMGIIFEYFLPETKSKAEWAANWHALGKFTAFDESYLVALEAVTNAFVKRGSRPNGVSTNALAQIRTNEAVLNWIWQLREFELGPDGKLAMRPVWNTPAAQLNNSPSLQAFVAANADTIKKNKHVLPLSMRAGSADALRYSWTISGVDPLVARSFANNTCNGCHSATQTNVDTAFHISPFRQGNAKVSRFLYDPSAATDEVRVRSQSLHRSLCQ